MRGRGDVGVVNPSAHGGSTWDSPVTYLGGRRRLRRTVDIRGVLTTGAEVGGVSGRQVTDEGKQPWEAQETLHVSALEVKGGD